MSNNSWSIKDAEFLDYLHEQANFHHTELASRLMAPEDRVEEEEALNTAMLAIESFENCRTGFIENLEKSLDQDLRSSNLDWRNELHQTRLLPISAEQSRQLHGHKLG